MPNSDSNVEFGPQLAANVPSVQVVSEREDHRRAATGKVTYRPGEFSIEDLEQLIEMTPRFGLWLDASAQTPQETVAEILRRESAAIVDNVL
jgi:hypothetical protein